MPTYDFNSTSLDIDVRSSWGSGMVVDLGLSAVSALNGWTIEFEYDGEIVNIWNARIVSRDGNRYVIENMGYNGSVAAGQTTGFGFQGSGSATEIRPISINGETADDTNPDPLPTVSVSDALASEEDGTVSFDISLSEASDQDVTITYETVAGSAQAGSDFVPQMTQVVIPAGQTSVSVSVPLVNDTAQESTEQFELRLTSADGAEIADGTGLGQITDSDPGDTPPDPAPPVVSVADASANEGNPGDMGTGSSDPSPGTGSLIADGPLSTSGNQIIDVNGNSVQIRAVNWFGAENDVRAPHGLWSRPMTDMMDQMVAEGFNAIRLPFSVQNILEDQVATSVAGDPSLAGLTTLEIFDRIIDYAEQIGIKIILDAHRVTQGNGAEGIWYSGQYDETDWIDAWEILANRYGDSTAVLGADLLNEPHLGTWGTGQRNDWPAAAEIAGNAVLDIAPDWLILVEGIGSYDGDPYWWGGQLQGVRDRPVVLNADDKLVYSPHDYPASIFNQPWFTDGSDLYEVFRENWGFIHEEGIAPILLGEFGSRLENPLDLVWAEAITNYLAGDFDGDGVNDLGDGEMGPSFAWWSWNPNSGDTGGYLNDDWLTVRQNAADLLDPLLESDATGGTPGGGSGPIMMTFDITLDAPAGAPVEYTFETRDGTAQAGEDYVATSGNLAFAIGQQTATIEVELLPDTDVEGDETFSLVLIDDDGNEVSAMGTIIDDDTDDSGDDPDDTGGGDTGGGDTGGGDTGDGGPFVGGGQTYYVGQTTVVTGFDPTRDVLDLGPNSIHNQIPIDTPDGFMMLHMFNSSLSLLVEGVSLADLHPENFAPIADAHLQQDLSAVLAYENGTGLVRPNTVYIRSHEQGLEEIVDFNPATDKISFFYLSVRGDGQRNFAVEDTAEGARFYNPLSGQSLTLRDVSFSELNSSHFEWRANQLEDGIAGRMGLDAVINGFTYVTENIFTGKSVAMAGGVDRAPYHSVQGYEDYTGTPIGGGSDNDGGDTGGGDTGGGDTGDDPDPIVVTVTGGSVTEADPGMDHMHDDGSTHVHDDGHRYITFQVSLDAPATAELTLSYATADGTAVADTTSDVAWDYHTTTGDLVFAVGEQTKTVTVAVHPDTLVEDTETFTFAVSGDNITGTLQATGTIYDNDTDDTGDTGGGDTGDGGPFVGGGPTYYVGQTTVVTGFDPTRDVLDLGPNSIHNQIPIDTPDGFMMLHMFNSSLSLLVEGVSLADLHPENFAPISDAHLQQDLSAVLAYENGTGLVRPNTVYIRSHEQGLEEIVDFNPVTDKISFFYLSVRGDGQRNFAVEDTAEGARFYNPLSGQSLTLRDVSFSELDSSHFEWRANQLEDGIAGRMGLDAVIDGFTYVTENIFTGKSVAMAGGVDRAPYHSVQGYEDYTGTPIGGGTDNGGGDNGGGDTGGGDTGDGDTGGGDTGDGGPFVGGGQTYYVGQTTVVTGFDPTRDVLDLGPNSIHNQIPIDTPDGFMMLHMFNSSLSLLVEGVSLADLHPENFAPISDAHLQQDLSAVLAYENGTGLVRPNTVYIRSHEQGLEEIVDFNPATDKISFFYLSVRGDGQRNFAVEDTAEGARFYNPLSGQSLTLRDVSFSELDSSHFEWRANQLEDGIAGRMGLDAVIDGFTYVTENIFSGKSVAMAGGVDRAPYHSQPDYTGTPIGDGSNDDGSGGDDTGGGDSGGGNDNTGDPGSGDDGSGTGSHELVLDDWGAGFVARFMLTPDTDVSGGWTARIATTADIVNIWNAEIVSHENGVLVVSNVSYNGNVSAGQTIEVGLQGSGTSAGLELIETTMFGGSTASQASSPQVAAVVEEVAMVEESDGSDVLDARLVVVNDWGSGATVHLEITNTSQSDHTGGWELSFDFNADVISGSWNNSWMETAQGDGITVSDVGWNGTVRAGETVEVGFSLNEGNLDETRLNTDADFYFL